MSRLQRGAKTGRDGGGAASIGSGMGRDGAGALPTDALRRVSARVLAGDPAVAAGSVTRSATPPGIPSTMPPRMTMGWARIVGRFSTAATFSKVTAGAGDPNATIDALMATAFTGSSRAAAGGPATSGGRGGASEVACLATAGDAGALSPNTTKERETISVGGATWTNDDAQAPPVIHALSAATAHNPRKRRPPDHSG